MPVGKRTILSSENDGTWMLESGVDAARRIVGLETNVVVCSATVLGNNLLLGTRRHGLWKLDAETDKAVRIVGIKTNVFVSMTTCKGGMVFIGTQNGLWALKERREDHDPVDLVTISEIVKPDSSEDGATPISTYDVDSQLGKTRKYFLVPLKNLLYKYRVVATNQHWSCSFAVDWKFESGTSAPAVANFWLNVSNQPGLLYAPECNGEVILKRQSDNGIVWRHPIHGLKPLSLTITNPGKYYAVATLKSALSETSAPCPPTGTITVSSDTGTPMWKTVLIICSPVLGWLALTLGLVAASRRFDWAFQLVTSPSIPKVFQWYVPLFELSRSVRLWMMEPTYQKWRAEVGNQLPFVEPTVQKPGGPALALAALLDYFKPFKSSSRKKTARRLWIAGRAGTGKSTLLAMFLARVVAPQTLRLSWQQFGVVPLLVRVRDFGSGEVVGAITSSLESYGIDDPKLVGRLLRTGDILVMLDGANERNWDDAIKSFVVRFPEVPVIISSQSGTSLSGVESWTLPLINPESGKKLLLVHAPTLPESAVAGVPESLWRDIKSGYDVFLLAEVLLKGILPPQTKVDLYRATVDKAAETWMGGQPISTLLPSLYQRGWELWKTGGYVLQPDGTLPLQFVEYLTDKHHLFVRMGDTFQFRHELMRQYFAACWIVEESVSVEDMIVRLSEEDVWKRGRSQQSDMFGFLTDVLRSPAELKAIARFASENIAQRAVLLDLAQQTARRRGWDITVQLAAKPADAAARRRFAVAFSFPGEHRAYVEQVAAALAPAFGGGDQGKARIFYDSWHEGAIIGYASNRKLQKIYADDSDLIVPFYCQDYLNKKWCGVELRAIEALLYNQDFERILPFRFDMVDIPSSFKTDVFPVVTNRPPEEIARLILERYNDLQKQSRK